VETFYPQQRFIDMRRSSFYHAQAEHARRLADIAIQQNIEDVLRRIAVELDRLADDSISGEADLGDPEAERW